jgi:ABC-type transport system involved in multi-copper enzyme maturation permease subunit
VAIREQGYRHWEGTYTGHALRWWTITKATLRSSVYTKGRLLLLVILAAVAWILPFFFGVFYFFGTIDPSRMDADAFLRDNLYQMLANWQWMWGVIFSAVVGSRLIANDLRSEALYIYLAKPLRRVDYLIGKFLACVLWMLPVTLAPALWVFLCASGSTNDQLKLKHASEIFGETVLVYLVFALVCAACAVTFSSLTKRWTFALIAWIGAVFLLLPIANITAEVTKDRRWLYLSIRDDVVIFAKHVWNPPPNQFQHALPDWVPALWILIGLFVVAAAVFVTRILRLEVAE